jgi:hypothetical protein
LFEKYIQKYLVQKFRLFLFKVKVIGTLILTQNGLGHILGDFVANASGHPGGGYTNGNYV